MSSGNHKLRYRKQKVSKQSHLLGFTSKTLMKIKIEEEEKKQKELEQKQLNELMDEEDEMNKEILQELMEELVQIKKKRHLEVFIRDNREEINNLSIKYKNKILNYIKNNFY